MDLPASGRAGRSGMPAIIAGTRPGTRIVQMGAGFVAGIIMEGLLSRGVDLTILVRSGYMVRRMMNPTASGIDPALVRGQGREDPHADPAQGPRPERSALQVDLGEGRTLPADLYLSVVGVDRTSTSWQAAESRSAGHLVDAVCRAVSRSLRGGRRG